MVANVNIQEKNYKQPSAGAVIGGVIAGSTVSKLTKVPHKLISPKIIEKMGKLSGSLTADDFSQVEKAMTNTIKSSGLEDKGVSIIKATFENISEVTEIMAKEFNKSIAKFLPKKVRDIFGSIFSSQMASGVNACYTFASKKIVMPEKELSLAFFHEAGHAMNANLSKFGKILQTCRPMTLLAIPIAIIALCKTKKADGEEPKNGLDKVTTFVKNNAGKLTFATFLPLLLEEGLATLKGNNFAKKFLNPELSKKAAKINALGYSTYLMLAALSGLGIYLGVKIKDAIAKKRSVDETK